MALFGSAQLRAADAPYFAASVAQTEADEYTRYELLAPETASFKIYYEVAATTAGARYFSNPIRKGSTASEESVRDAMLGAAPLAVTPEQALRVMCALEIARESSRSRCTLPWKS